MPDGEPGDDVAAINGSIDDEKPEVSGRAAAVPAGDVPANDDDDDDDDGESSTGSSESSSRYSSVGVGGSSSGSTCRLLVTDGGEGRRERDDSADELFVDAEEDDDGGLLSVDDEGRVPTEELGTSSGGLESRRELELSKISAEESSASTSSGARTDQNRRFVLKLPEFGSKSAKKSKLLLDSDREDRTCVLKKLALPFPHPSPVTKATSALRPPPSTAPTEVFSTTMMMDPPTPTPILRSRGRFLGGKLNFIPKLGKSSAEYQLSPTSPKTAASPSGKKPSSANGSEKESPTKKKKATTAGGEGGNAPATGRPSSGSSVVAVVHPTYRRRCTEDDPPETAGRLVAPPVRAPIVEPEKTADFENINGGGDEKKPTTTTTTTVAVEVNDECDGVKNNGRNAAEPVGNGGSSSSPADVVIDVGKMEEVDEINKDADNGAPATREKQWNWFLPGFLVSHHPDRGDGNDQSGRRRHPDDGASKTSSTWAQFPRRVFGFGKGAKDDELHEDSPKKSLVDPKSSTPPSSPGDGPEVVPLTAEHHENSSSPLIAPQRDADDVDADATAAKKTAAKILTSTPQKNGGKMNGGDANGKKSGDANGNGSAAGRLKIGDETVLTIVGGDDDDEEDADGSRAGDEERLKLTENVGGVPQQPSSDVRKNGAASATASNGSPAKSATAPNGNDDGGRKFKVPEWLWKSADAKAKNGDARFAPGSTNRGISRHKRALCVGFISILVVFFIIVVIALLSSKGESTAASPESLAGGSIFVDTACGKIQGRTRDGGIEYLGIPYAEPPIGAKRWRRSYPRPKEEQTTTPSSGRDDPPDPNVVVVPGCPVAWVGVRDATAAAPVCVQFSSGGGPVVGQEDCLTVDVFAPKTGRRIKSPVVVYVAAETLNGGSRHASSRYNFAALAAAKGTVFVVPRFRLSALGFLTLSDLTKEAGKGQSGNYALSDLLAALDWVQNRIFEFGGDARSVTLVGHMAGGSLVTALTAARPDGGGSVAGTLFHRVWVASGGGVFANESLYISEALNSILREKVKCRSLECMRGRDAADVVASVPENRRRFWFSMPPEEDGKLRRSWLVVDGGILRASPISAWADPNFPRADVPAVFGTTRHAELRSWTKQLSTSWNSAVVSQLNTTAKVRDKINEDFAAFEDEELKTVAVRAALGDPAAAAAEVVETVSADDPRAKYFALVTDVRTRCPLLRLARAAAADGRFGPAVYFYDVATARKSPPSSSSPFDAADAFSDVDAILGAYAAETPEQTAYVASIQAAFFEFVKTGKLPEVDGGAGPASATSVRDGKVYEFGDRLRLLDAGSAYSHCDTFLDSPLYPGYARMD